ncbi:MAG: hypothetical protein AAGF23_04545 [Acidobacteriota bacterium]
MPRCYRLLLTSAVAVGLVFALPSGVYAGAVLQATTTYHAEKPPRVEGTTTLAHDGYLRIDVETTGDGQTALHDTIYRGVFGDFLLVDHGDKAFTLLDRDAISDLEAQLQYTMLQLDRQMAELPVEQRRRMRDALASPPAQSAPDVVKTETVEERAGVACRLYEFRRGDEVVKTVWVAPWDEVPGGAELRRALEGLRDFTARLKEALQSVRSEALGGAQVFDIGSNPFEDFDALGGLPVHTTEFEDGKPTFETAINAFSERSMTPADFLPPPSYKQRAWASE